MGFTFNPRDGEYVKVEFAYGNDEMTPEEERAVVKDAVRAMLTEAFSIYEDVDKLLSGVKG